MGNADPRQHSEQDRQPSWWQDATRWPVVRRALCYAAVVGAVLISINHGDAILRGDVDRARAMRMALTVLVPYLVSTFSAVGATRQMRAATQSQNLLPRSSPPPHSPV